MAFLLDPGILGPLITAFAVFWLALGESSQSKRTRWLHRLALIGAIVGGLGVFYDAKSQSDFEGQMKTAAEQRAAFEQEMRTLSDDRAQFERDMRVLSEERARFEQEMLSFADKRAAVEADLREQSMELTRSVLGGDSYCYLMFVMMPTEEGLVPRPVLVHGGEHPLYDVTARLFNRDLFQQLSAANPADKIMKASTSLKIGNIIPGYANLYDASIDLGPLPMEGGFDVYFTARNGAFQQNLRFARVDGQLRQAIRVKRNDKVVHENVPEDFPRSEQGMVEW